MEYTFEVLIKICLFFAGIGGFLVALRIYKHKKMDVPLVCPIGFDCNAVVHSDYSRFMGIRVELLGMSYYFVTFISYFLFLVYPDIFSPLFLVFLGTMALIAVLFSTYLVLVQGLVIKQWCSWCLVSAGISLFIFLLTLFNFGLGNISELLFK